MSKREELIREYCRQVNESLHFIQKYMEGIVPAGRCDEKIYWETKKLSEQLHFANGNSGIQASGRHSGNSSVSAALKSGNNGIQKKEQIVLIQAYLTEAAKLYEQGEPWKTRITDRRLCRNTILNHLQMLANVSFWLKNLGEPLAEEVCGWLLTQESEDVQKVRSGQSLENVGEIYPAVQRKRA